MNRTGILVLIVAALGVGAFFILKQGGEAPKTTLVGADREFAVPKDEVYKVFLADRKGNKTTLTREASGWMYNGKYPARPDAIASLLMAIDQIRMKFKPVDAAVPNMVSGLATDGIKVEVYGKKGDLLKAY